MKFVSSLQYETELRWEGTVCKLRCLIKLQIKIIKQHDFAEATPKRILQQMRVRGLRIAHIKSHLQVCMCIYTYIC